MTWVETTADQDTIVWVHEYWSDAYGMEAPVRLDAELIDIDGDSLTRWPIWLDEGQTLPISVRKACAGANLGSEFAGHLLLTHRHASLVPGRPVQVFGEYQFDSGGATGVHGQYGIVERPLAQAIGALRVDTRYGRRSGVVLVNTLLPPTAARGDISAVVEIFNSTGERRRKRIGSLAHRSSSKVYFDDLVDDLPGFLDGAPGHARVILPAPASRLLSFVEEPDGSTVVNHGTIDRTFDQASGVPVGWTHSQPIASVVAWMRSDRRTVLSAPNRFGPREGDHELSFTIRDLDGEIAAVTTRPVTRRGIVEVDLTATVERLAPHLAQDPAVHIEVAVTPLDPRSEGPAHLDLLLGLFDENHLVADVLVGGGFFNEEVPSDLPWPDIRRTRVFSRVRTDDGWRSLVFLANPSGDPDYAVTASPVIRLLDANGDEVGHRQMEIPPHGSILVDVADLFGPGNPLADGFGAIKVRDTTARLYGYCLVDREGASALPFDHLVGG